MKKRFFTILAFASLLSLSLCNTSCSDDDDDDDETPTEKTDSTQKDSNTTDSTASIKEATAAATTIADEILNYVAAEKTEDQSSSTVISDLEESISKVTASADTTYKNAVIEQVAEQTGLTTETVTEIINNAGGVSGLATIFEEMPAEQKESVLNNASSYAEGYSDAQDLASAYATLASSSTTTEEKNAALDQLETDIKDHYQTSTDTTYKKTYVAATATATGLPETIVEQILEAENPKETAAALLGISLPSDDTPSADDSTATDTEKATEDAKAAAELLNSVKGKSITELMSDVSIIAKVNTYKTAYTNGSDEYKAAFEQGLIDNGVSSDAAALLSSEGEIDYASLISALGISLF